jgi:hypothetical protein
MYFWGGYSAQLGRHVPGKEGGKQVLACLAPNSKVLVENPLAGKVGQKNSTKREFGEFTSIEKCAQQTLTERILAK